MFVFLFVFVGFLVIIVLLFKNLFLGMFDFLMISNFLFGMFGLVVVFLILYYLMEKKGNSS